MTPKLGQNQMSELKETKKTKVISLYEETSKQNYVKIKGQNRKKHRKWKLFNYMNSPKTVVKPYPNLKNSPLGPQKVKNDPKSKSKSKVKIERSIENKFCSVI